MSVIGRHAQQQRQQSHNQHGSPASRASPAANSADRRQLRIDETGRVRPLNASDLLLLHNAQPNKRARAMPSFFGNDAGNPPIKRVTPPGGYYWAAITCSTKTVEWYQEAGQINTTTRRRRHDDEEEEGEGYDDEAGGETRLYRPDVSPFMDWYCGTYSPRLEDGNHKFTGYGTTVERVIPFFLECRLLVPESRLAALTRDRPCDVIPIVQRRASDLISRFFRFRMSQMTREEKEEVLRAYVATFEGPGFEPHHMAVVKERRMDINDRPQRGGGGGGADNDGFAAPQSAKEWYGPARSTLCHVDTDAVTERMIECGFRIVFPHVRVTFQTMQRLRMMLIFDLEDVSLEEKLDAPRQMWNHVIRRDCYVGTSANPLIGCPFFEMCRHCCRDKSLHSFCACADGNILVLSGYKFWGVLFKGETDELETRHMTRNRALSIRYTAAAVGLLPGFETEQQPWPMPDPLPTDLVPFKMMEWKDRITNLSAPEFTLEGVPIHDPRAAAVWMRYHMQKSGATADADGPLLADVGPASMVAQRLIVKKNPLHEQLQELIREFDGGSWKSVHLYFAVRCFDNVGGAAADKKKGKREHIECFVYGPGAGYCKNSKRVMPPDEVPHCSHTIRFRLEMEAGRIRVGVVCGHPLCTKEATGSVACYTFHAEMPEHMYHVLFPRTESTVIGVSDPHQNLHRLMVRYAKRHNHQALQWLGNYVVPPEFPTDGVERCDHLVHPMLEVDPSDDDYDGERRGADHTHTPLSSHSAASSAARLLVRRPVLFDSPVARPVERALVSPMLDRRLQQRQPLHQEQEEGEYQDRLYQQQRQRQRQQQQRQFVPFSPLQQEQRRMEAQTPPTPYDHHYDQSNIDEI